MIRAALAGFLLLLVAACSQESTPPRALRVEGPSPTTSAIPVPPVGAASGGVQARPTVPPDFRAEPPRADLYDLARRFRGVTIPRQTLTEPPAASVGDTRRFFILDLDATKAVEISATLVEKTAHADLWVQQGQRVSRAEAQRAGEQFEQQVYPRVTAAFGLPAPAPDGGAGRISILHIALTGAGGYFAGSDQLPRALVAISNEQQIVYLDLKQVRPGASGYAGLLAHEFQHLVHQQRNEYADTWLNEGLSALADEALGGSLEFLRRFETAPDTQLTTWPVDGSATPSYGAAQSFLRYLLGRFGGIQRAGDLAAERTTGVSSVERYLQRGGFGVSFLDVFADWTVANLLDTPDGTRYAQPEIEHRIRALDTLSAPGSGSGTVRQFGTRYLELSPGGRDLTLRIDGADAVARIPATPTSGQGLWWSNRSDSMDSTLTRELDLRNVSRATLRFKLWYEIEKDYDFAYVAASRDSGATWTALRGRHTTTQDPLRVAYGSGYSGRSGGGGSPVWVDEEIDLSAFAGSAILLRFEYVTDEASVADGLAVDDLSIQETGWRDDGERDGDWTASGFVRLTGPLPQRFIVQVVEEAVDGGVTVRRVEMDAANTVEIRIPGGLRKATVVLSGATLGTTIPAGYRWEVRRT